MLQIVRFVMLFSILIYAVMVKQLAVEHSNPSLVIYLVVAGLAVSIIGILFFFRAKFVQPSEGVLATDPTDSVAVRRWQTGHLITYGFGEAIALYGMVLHFIGFTHAQVAPFFVVGFLLIAIFPPRQPELAR
jgi:hypothetical protein